jgi:hypothetical protein
VNKKKSDEKRRKRRDDGEWPLPIIPTPDVNRRAKNEDHELGQMPVKPCLKE